MPDPCSPRNVLVAGGASGLGAACVRRFAATGASVLVADVNEVAGNMLAEELSPQVRFQSMDVTDSGQIAAAIENTTTEFGDLHVVVNCAGILRACRIVGREDVHDLVLFQQVVDVNLVGTFNLLRLSAAAMKQNEPGEDGQRGVIINTASVAAFEGQIGQAAYAASKGGVAALTLPAARELARFGIRVVAIAPGIFETPMMDAAPPELRQSLESQIPFPSRFGRPDEYATLCQHVVDNQMLNGCVIRLDGAVRMGAK